MLSALTLITLNFWGLPPVGTFSLSLLKAERLGALCHQIKSLSEAGKVDVIALQEVWDAKDRAALKNCGLPHSVDLDDPNRLIDSGLLLLSRVPLDPATPPLRQRYEKPSWISGTALDGEAAADKSVLVARFRTPVGSTFVVGDTHLVSRYTRYPDYDRYGELRSQEFRLAVDTVKAYRASPTEPAFLLGDFNTGPRVDSRENPDWASLTPELDYDRSQNARCTVCPENPFQDGNEERMDFIFSITGSGAKRLQESRRFDEPVDLGHGVQGYLSDHYGWSATYSLSPSN